MLVVSPNAGLTSKNDEELAKKLQSYKATLTEEEIKKIVDDTGQSFRLLDGDVGAVDFVYEVYDECAGPQGFGIKYQALDDFEDFVYTLAKHRKYNGHKWLPVWLKDE